jgi:hypothetical protein
LCYDSVKEEFAECKKNRLIILGLPVFYIIMNEEYILSKGWTIDQESSHYICPWESHLKYNMYRLEDAVYKQDQQDHLITHGMFPKKIRLNHFGWGLWFVIKNNSYGKFVASVADKDAADEWIRETKEWLKIHKFKEYSYKQFLAVENIKDDYFNNVLIESSHHGYHYYNVPTFRKYLKTLCKLIERDYPKGFTEKYWDGEPVIPSFGTDISNIPEEFKEQAKMLIAQYNNKKKEYKELECRKKSINRILELKSEVDDNIAEIYSLLKEINYLGDDHNFSIETLETLY